MPVAYSYLRFSSAEQLKGDSLRRQLDKSRSYAAEHGLTLDETLQDHGVSAFRGKNRERGALGRFLQLVNQGKVAQGSYLLVESLDRLSRESPLKAMRPFSDLIEAGIRIVTLADAQVYDASRLEKEDWALIGSLMIMMRANDESKTKRFRAVEKWNQLHEQARRGKIITSRCPGWLVRDGDHWVERKKQVEAVRLAFQWVAQGVGSHEVAAMLNRTGLPPLGQPTKRRKGKEPLWYASIIARLGSVLN
jgi:DNA invertase Pin-like site-specific DNA recombinase